MIDTSVKIGNWTYRSPVFLASGTAGFGFEFDKIIDLSVIGGIAVKTITTEPREGNPPPRIWETPSGMLNSIGLANPGLDVFLDETAPKLENLPTDIVVSVGGTSIEDFKHLVSRVSEISFASAIELNLSCPNVKDGGMHFGRDAKTVFELLSELRKTTDKALWAKLSPQVTDIVELGKASADGGADAVAVTNTFPAMAIDIATQKPRLGANTGGLSGSAIHPVAVALVFKLYDALNIPIIGGGGISHPEDAVELMLAGAAAVQIGSGVFSNSSLPIETQTFIAEYAKSKGYEKVSDITGAVKID